MTHDLALVRPQRVATRLVCAISVLSLGKLLVLLLLVVLGGCKDVLSKHLVRILLSKSLLSGEHGILRGRHLRCLLLIQEHLLLLRGEAEGLWLLLRRVLRVIPTLSVILIHF